MDTDQATTFTAFTDRVEAALRPHQHARAEQADPAVVARYRLLETIRAFAGDEVLKAKYYPEDDEFLLEFEPTVDTLGIVTVGEIAATPDYAARFATLSEIGTLKPEAFQRRYQ